MHDDHSPGRTERWVLQVVTEHSMVYRLVYGPDPHRVRHKGLLLLSALVTVNITVWVIAIIVYRPYPSMLGTGALAYTLGLRHAVDADHISAIDNVTRKLLSDNQHPVCVGLFFSLGHSTIVFITSVIIAATANAVANGVDNFSQIGGVIGTSISIAFLLVIALLNVIVLVGVIKTLRKLKRDGVHTETNIEEFLQNRGILGRFLRPIFRFINASWKMYPLGLLFGLGFDTSTEITLLGITAIQGANGMSMWLIILLPLLFTAGMSLIDSLDGMLMLFTYTWAYVNPIRKLYYNLTITLISVVVACLVALVEFFAMIGEELHLNGPCWQFWATLSDSFEWIGIVIVGAFIITWLVSSVIYRLSGYKDLERKFDEHSPPQDASMSMEEGGIAAVCGEKTDDGTPGDTQRETPSK